MQRKSGTILLATVGVSVMLLGALLLIPAQPTGITYAEDDPAVIAQEKIREAMPPIAFSIPFLVSGSESVDENAVSRTAFDEVLARQAAARDDPAIAPYVFTHIHPHLQMEIPSIWSLPDTLRAFMNNETPLTYALGWHPDTGGPGARYETAREDEWQDALTRLLEFEPRDGERPFARAVSEDAHQANGVWHAKSLFVVPGLHHADFFADYSEQPSQATPETPLYEEMEFHVWAVLEQDALETRWLGIGVGIQSEIESQVAESARLIAGSFFVIGILLYLTLRNWRDFLVAYLTLPLVVIWMMGAARLVGLSYNQFTAMLPVLILALGVDFAIHGVRRYREERATNRPAAALTTSLSRVGPVLALAAATTATAFLSNAFSDVVELSHWGIMGALGILCALWLSGVFAPALRHQWDRHRERRGTLREEPRGGIVSRRLEHGTPLGRLCAWGARHSVMIIVLVVLVTAPATYIATGITSDFDADDFLSRDSYLLVGSERLEREFPQEGEPGALLIEGDITDPRILDALHVGFERYDAMGYRPNFDYSLVRAVQTAMAYPDENDAHYQDTDDNGIPDRQNDLHRLLDQISTEGVWVQPDRPNPPPPELYPGIPYPEALLPDPPQVEPMLVYSPATIQQIVHQDATGGYDMTVMHFGIPGTEDFTVIPAAEKDLREAATELWSLEGESVSTFTLTGEPFKRYNMVQAITQSLKISITLSVIGCFLIVLFVLRDLPLAVATTLPVLVLVAWLFAFMVLYDMSLNVVTVTVAAMAIGVGIDYSIHITGRFREESRTIRDPVLAVRRAMDSSGVALLGSATTTIAGFLVLTFAPMPLFATFGVITAAMTAASFLAATTLLPPLLVLISRWRRRSHSKTQKRALLGSAHES